MTITRRRFLHGAMGAGASVLLGCSGEPAKPTFRGVVPFTNSGPRTPVNTPLDEGLDGRLYTSVESLAPDAMIVPSEYFFIRTRCPATLDLTNPWSIDLAGLVDQPVQLALDDLLANVRPMGVHLVECAGNDNLGAFRLISAAEWSGVPIADVLSRVSAKPQATGVVIGGYDDHPTPLADSQPGASWFFRVKDLEQAGAFLATQMNGQPLSRDHGFPVRLIVPGWYGCVCIKWLNEIRFVVDDEPAPSQMTEYARRTGQTAEHALARDYTPALIEHSATPVRVEQHIDGKRVFYRIVGIMWGGQRVTDQLVIRCGPREPYQPVTFPTTPSTTKTWTLWTFDWQPTAPDHYKIELKFTDSSLPTRRMNSSYYTRQIFIGQV